MKLFGYELVIGYPWNPFKIVGAICHGKGLYLVYKDKRCRTTWGSSYEQVAAKFNTWTIRWLLFGRACVKERTKVA